MILYFLADIFRNPNLQKEYEEDPDRVMQREGLTGPEIELLKNGDAHRIAAAVATEAESLLRPNQYWAGPMLGLTSIKPDQAPSGSTLTATVIGRYFKDSIYCWLERDKTKIEGAVSNVQTGAQSSLTATFSIPPGIPRGSYNLWAAQPGSKPVELPNAVTVS